MKHILIADPDFRTRRAFALLLERRLGVRDIAEAWDRASLEHELAAAPPDLLMLDCCLPGLSAAERAALARRPECGRMVLTSVDADDVAAAEALHAAFICKCALPDEVVATLKSLIAV